MASQDKKLYLMFDVSGERFAAQVEHIKHILKFGDISPLPGQSETMIGISELRGETIPILNTSILMGIKKKEFGSDNYIMLCDSDNDTTIGLAVDKMSGNITISDEEINSVSEGKHSANKNFIIGTISNKNGIVVVVDILSLSKRID